ncbi:MAG: zinc ribbon domain-containing protein [Candidatus Nanopelagicales bacterium]
MTDIVPFTDNYRDLSNTDGYQFEFFCERCGNGYRSPFQADLMEKGRGLLRSAGGLFGGALSNITGAADDLMDRGTNSAAKDKALAQAVEAVRPQFRQCRACGNWVCVDVCWNAEIGQCATCSPFVTDELSRAQAAAQVQQIQEKVKETDWTADIDVTTRAKVACPSCGAPVEGGKFCSSCGAKLSPTAFCTECGAEIKAGAKFCGECGTPAPA